MGNHICYYSIIKYFPIPIRHEPKNIGIVMQCEEVNYLKFKFIENLPKKLGTQVGGKELEFIRSLLNNYVRLYNHSEENLFFNDIDTFKRKFLEKLSNSTITKIQFSGPNFILTSNPSDELEYLFKTFVDDEEEKPKIKRSQLKTEIRREFHNLRLLSNGAGIKENFKLKGRSSVEHIVDFYFKNGSDFVIETVNLRRTKEKEKDVYETIAKLSDLSLRLKDSLKPISIVSYNDGDSVKDLLRFLKSYSKVYDYSNGQRNQFFIDIRNIVNNTNNANMYSNPMFEVEEPTP